VLPSPAEIACNPVAESGRVAYIVSLLTKDNPLKTRFARDASTGLSWLVPEDRVLIAINLRSNAEILAGEILLAKSPKERIALLDDLQRVYTRLAVCDMDAARKAERRIEAEMQRDAVCRITLEKMADMVEDANMGAQLPRNFLVMGQAYARLIRDEKLDDWFSTGPYSGLGRLALTVADLDIDTALKEREALPELVRMARMIPLDQGVDEEKIESQIFRDGLKMFRRHQGLEKESHEM
jgi:hypothetical protein